MRLLPPVLMLTLAAAPASAKRKIDITAFDSAADALSSLLSRQPRVIGFGEYHAIEGGAKVKSSLAHFRDELLPAVKLLASDLILETWVTEGTCGAEESKVVAQVQETTKRPEATESELVTLIKKARAAGVDPHILTVTCKEYRALLDAAGEVDFVRLLGAITRLLEKQVEAALKDRSDRPERIILVYGGAIHNKLQPRAELRAFTYGPSVRRLTKGKYLEVDLYVPEFIETDEHMRRQPWYASLSSVPPDKTALVRRGPDSFIIVLPRTPKPPAPPTPVVAPPEQQPPPAPAR